MVQERSNMIYGNWSVTISRKCNTTDTLNYYWICFLWSFLNHMADCSLYKRYCDNKAILWKNDSRKIESEKWISCVRICLKGWVGQRWEFTGCVITRHLHISQTIRRWLCTSYIWSCIPNIYLWTPGAGLVSILFYKLY